MADELCSDDLIVSYVDLKGQNNQKVLICSAYLPGEKEDPTEELTKVLQYAKEQKSELIVGCDANAHHTIWGSTGINKRGASTEPRRCYWCGPLAEQVHRSRRSAPCSNSDHVTVCEPTYDYCAVVATSPHRIESRYCVKVYQDECYPLYCNSTKTWKITCPCRGDLCNGPNTERENRAFALLPGLVAKTHKARIKKRTANTAPHIIKHDGKKKIISNDDAEIHNMSNPSSDDVNNMTNDNKLIVTENDVLSNKGNNSSQQSENMQSDQPTNIVIEHHNEESTVANQAHIQTTNELIEIAIHVSDPTEESSRMKGNDQPCTDLPTTTVAEEANKITEPVKNEVELTATTAQSDTNNQATMKTTETNIVVQSEATKATDAVQQDVIEIKPTDKPHSEPLTTTTEIMPNDQPMIPEEQMQNDAPAISPTECVQEMKTTETVKIVEPPTKDIVKASEIPTAEALQQNGSPPATAAPVPITEKPTEPTTTEATVTPTVMTTPGQIAKITTTPASRRKNNEAVRLTFSYALLLIFVVYL